MKDPTGLPYRYRILFFKCNRFSFRNTFFIFHYVYNNINIQLLHFPFSSIGWGAVTTERICTLRNILSELNTKIKGYFEFAV